MPSLRALMRAASAAASRLSARRGVVHEERLLRFERRRFEPGRGQRLGNPVPADMAREILLPGSGEQIIALVMTRIRANRSGRSSVGQFFPRFPVVKGDEESGPRLCCDGSCESTGSERKIDPVSVRRRQRKAALDSLCFRRKLGHQGLLEGAGFERNAGLPPVPRLTDQPVTGLGIEQFV